MTRFPLMLLALAVLPLWGQNLYLSDGLGNQGEPLAGLRGDEEWYLRVSAEGDLSARVLYKDQAEWKRWEVRSVPQDPPVSVESYYFKTRIREINEYAPSGRLLTEQLFDSNGDLLEHRRYRYDAQGALSGILLLDQEGAEEQSYNLFYREEGAVREMAGTGLGGEGESRVLWRARDREETFFDRVFLMDGSRAYRYEYEEGNLAVRLRFDGEEETERVLYAYKDNGKLEKESIWSDREKALTTLYYDDSGQVILENRFIGGLLKKSIQNFYDGDLLVRYEERSESEKILWEYEYREDPDHPAVSTLYRNGELIKRIFREEDRTKEIIYKNGVAVYESIIEDGDGEEEL